MHIPFYGGASSLTIHIALPRKRYCIDSPFNTTLYITIFLLKIVNIFDCIDKYYIFVLKGNTSINTTNNK